MVTISIEELLNHTNKDKYKSKKLLKHHKILKEHGEFV